MNSETSGKIIVILGPTASGKSDIAIKLAKKFDGEVISADSRQIYRGMDIGTGKILRDKNTGFKIQAPKFKVYYSSGIPHHMIDIINPKTYYNAAKFKKSVNKIIPDILNRGKVPIICGGTGFWIKTIVDDISFPEVKPDWKLRRKLNEQSALKLFKILKKLDPDRAKTIDKKNKTRLIRAIEICKTIGKVPLLSLSCRKEDNKKEFLQIGIKIPKEKLNAGIQKRLEKRFRQGMLAEAKKLRAQDVGWKRMENFGLEYRWLARYLQNKISRHEMQRRLLQDIKKYARRQMTWFRKDRRIKWLKSYGEIERETKKFLKKNI